MKVLKSSIATRAHSGANSLLYFEFRANGLVAFVLGNQPKVAFFIDLRLRLQFGFFLETLCFGDIRLIGEVLAMPVWTIPPGMVAPSLGYPVSGSRKLYPAGGIAACQ